MRVVCATHQDLKALIKEGRFREDLYYRLAEIVVSIPPLRERKTDIPFLATHFLEEFAQKNHKPPMKVAPEAMPALMNHPWRGNVRELRNLIERIVGLKDGDTLQLQDLPEKVRLGEPSAGRGKERATGEEGISFQTAVSEFEKALILSALEKTNWVKNRAADLLKIKRTTLVEKIKRYHLEKSGDA